MAEERFPLRKYLRRIDELERDFRRWESIYDREWNDAITPADRAALSRRSEILQELRQRLHDMFHELEALPRLS